MYSLSSDRRVPFPPSRARVCARRVGLALALALSTAAAARAQDVFPLAEDAGVRALIEEALSRNPAIRATRERAEAATQ